MDLSEWRENARSELRQAEAARRAGNEGKARVCARRAAGIIAGEYMVRQGFSPKNASAIVRLQSLATLTDIHPLVREIAGHFLIRITPDHKLPVNVDLIAEASWLARHLLGETIAYED
jgi:hypothetical protein